MRPLVLALVGLLTGAQCGATPAAGGTRATRRPLPAPTEPRAVAIENPGALAPLAAALRALAADRAAGQPGTLVRVLHFGDSHVAADWWSGALREHLQARFGDAGPGLVMPGQPWKYYHHERARSLRAGWRTVGLERDPGDGMVGLLGVALSPRQHATEATVIATCTRFEVQLGLPLGEACVRLTVDGAPLYSGALGTEMPPPDTGAQMPVNVEVVALGDPPGDRPPVVGSCRAVAFLRAQVPPGEHVIAVDDACGGQPLVLGVDLVGSEGGVLVDTLGLNGAELRWLERTDPEVRRLLLARADPRLIVVSYGTNDMTAGDFSAERYITTARRALAGLRADAPRAAVLVTGPTDRSHRRKGARRDLVLRRQPEIIQALRAAALAEGCAFWDARAAMGGAGALHTWRRRGLAARDLVHLTEPGYRRLAQLLAEALMDAVAPTPAAPVAAGGP